jgi:hypothetical protein
MDHILSGTSQDLEILTAPAKSTEPSPSQAKLRSTNQGFGRTVHLSLILVEMCKTSPSVSSTNFTAVPR